MKIRTQVLICIALSLMVCFLSVGYAALTDTLSIRGKAEIEIPSGLFIIDMELDSQSGIGSQSATYPEYSSTVECNISKNVRNGTGSVRYKITVLNNTEHEYAYRGLYYQTSADNYDNEYISKTNSNSMIGVVTEFPNGTTVLPRDTLEFYVTYTIGRSLSRNKVYKTLINYQFGINVSSEIEAVDAVHEKFLNILNTQSTYETLVDVLDNKYDGYNEWTSNYVGNVGNATSDDAMAVNTLFAGQLQLVINGQVKPATVLIKHENLDWNNMTGDDYTATHSNGGRFEGKGCEMTLYLTTDPLTQSYGYATVYVTVFTCDRDENGNIVGKWYKIGETYTGDANIVGYKGEAGGTGSFVTDNWLSYAGTYRVTDNYSYYVQEDTSIKTLMQIVDPDMINEFQSLLNDAKAMIDDTTYAGTGIMVVEDAYAKASRYYTLDADGNPLANPDITRAQLCPIMQELEATLRVAQEKIDEIIQGGKTS